MCHNEQLLHEVYMGNDWTDEEFKHSSWQTKRKGEWQGKDNPVFVSMMEIRLAGQLADPNCIMGSPRLDAYYRGVQNYQMC